MPRTYPHPTKHAPPAAADSLGRSRGRSKERAQTTSKNLIHLCVPSRVPLPLSRAIPPPAMTHTPSCHAREKSPSLPAPNSPNTEILPNSPSFQASRHGFLSTQKATPPTRDVELWMASSVADPPFQGRPRATSATFARQVALEKSCCPSPTPSYKAVLCVR